MKYTLTREMLLKDLYMAFYDARRHKANKPYVKFFERDLKDQLERLCDDLFNRTYEAEPSRCFIITYPKKREVFAAQFRDRVVHHLYFNYTHEIFERTFIQDTYSCIENRGTHCGIRRLTEHIRKESRNYLIPCWAIKIDIRGYFMHINRNKLLKITTGSLKHMFEHKVSLNSDEKWCDKIDTDFILWLTGKIILLNPKENCIKNCSDKCWEDLDKNKSLFYTQDGYGLPIGNLTSLLFSNVYLNMFDQFMKRVIKCKHYGRYVDDAYVISKDKNWLKSIINKIELYLKEQLSLELHKGKLLFLDIYKGVDFLGAFVKPFRNYISNSSLRRMRRNISGLNFHDCERVWRSCCSYLGAFAHYPSFKLKWKMFMTANFLNVSTFDKCLKKMNKPVKLINHE